MIQCIEHEINGHKYQINQFPATKGMKMAVRLAKLAGSGFSEGAVKGKTLKDIDVDPGMVVRCISEALDEDATTKLVTDLLSSTVRNGKGLGQVEGGVLVELR